MANSDDIEDVLRKTGELLDATRVELMLFPQEGSDTQAISFVVESDVEIGRTGPIGSKDLIAATATAQNLNTPMVRTAKAAGEHSMIGALSGEGGPVGLFKLDGRLRSDAFSTRELELFETLLEHLSVTFEKEELDRAVVALERRSNRLQHEVDHDYLTGLSSRTFLARRLELELTEGRLPSLLYVDLDDFKMVNDGYGHDAGDEVLRVMAHRFERIANGPSACVARIGGDEFAILLGEQEDAAEVAQALLQATTKPVALGGATVEVRASIGVARAAVGVEGSELMKMADTAMYGVKDLGKSGFAFATL